MDTAVPQCDAQQKGIKSEKENVDSRGGTLAAAQKNKLLEKRCCHLSVQSTKEVRTLFALKQH